MCFNYVDTLFFVYIFSTRTKDDMHLYRHSTECPSAIQMFLDENPKYWRFVPMSNEEANQTEQNVTVSTMDIKSTEVHEDEKVKAFIANLPTPPPNYRFSQRQYHQQYAYFQPKRNLLMPNLHLDLYNAKIVAVSKCYTYGFVWKIFHFLI
jgi:hypothetical protein